MMDTLFVLYVINNNFVSFILYNEAPSIGLKNYI